MGHRAKRGAFLVALWVACGSLAATAAQAGSAAQPGQTVGLPTGAKLPVGLYFVDTSSFGVRNTLPRGSATNVNLPAFVLSTPWSVYGARVQFVLIQPFVAVSPQRAQYRTALGQQLVATQFAYDLGHDFGVSYLFGAYLPAQSRRVTQSASLSNRVAFSYTGNGFNLTANFLQGSFLDRRSPVGVYYPDYLNLDLTATKKFGKWQVGPVAFGSTDLTSDGRYRRQAQFAVGGLVGYDFGRFNLQGYVTRDVAQRNYGGYETRGWLRLILPIFQDKGSTAPNRTLVTRAQNG